MCVRNLTKVLTCVTSFYQSFPSLTIFSFFFSIQVNDITKQVIMLQRKHNEQNFLSWRYNTAGIKDTALTGTIFKSSDTGDSFPNQSNSETWLLCTSVLKMLKNLTNQNSEFKGTVLCYMDCIVFRNCTKLSLPDVGKTQDQFSCFNLICIK